MPLVIVALGWIFVVVMVAVAEVVSPTGTWLGALLTLVFWGLLPLAIVLYILGTPARRRARAASGPSQPDGAGHAAGDAVAPEREEA